MRSSFIVAALIVLMASSRDAMAVDVVIGSFEGTTLSGGWKDWGYNGPHEFENSTTGATHGSQSIKVTPGTLGFAQSLTFKLQDLPNNVEAYNGFVSNTHIAYDVTWNAAEWNFLGDGWNGARLMLTYNEQGAGWDPAFGINPDGNGFTQPNLDTGNPTNQGFWDLTNYPGVHTRTMSWDYSHLLPLLTSNATGGWLEMILETNFGNFAWPASIYIDNVRFTTPPAGLQGDYNGDDVVDAADYTVWRDNLGVADESSINNNGDGLNGVDAADYDLWKSSFGAMPGSGSLSAAAVPEPGTWLLGSIAIGWLGTLRRRAD